MNKDYKHYYIRNIYWRTQRINGKIFYRVMEFCEVSEPKWDITGRLRATISVLNIQKKFSLKDCKQFGKRIISLNKSINCWINAISIWQNFHHWFTSISTGSNLICILSMPRVAFFVSIHNYAISIQKRLCLELER